MPDILPAPAAPESTDAPSPWLTVAEAATRARVSTKTIYGAVGAGTLRHARINRRRSLRFLPAWVDAWVKAENTPVEITGAATPLRVAR